MKTGTKLTLGTAFVLGAGVVIANPEFEQDITGNVYSSVCTSTGNMFYETDAQHEDQKWKYYAVFEGGPALDISNIEGIEII